MITFWDNYYTKPLDKIPWQRTQADWFKELIDQKKITGTTAIDLGCGTGMKSIYLAQHTDFQKIIGIDIASQAIQIAQTNAHTFNVEEKTSFLKRSITNWQIEETFDFILDWAALHCLKPESYQKYVHEINSHSKPGTLYLLRTFNTKTAHRSFFEETVDSLTEKIYFISLQKIQELFPNFIIIKTHQSKPRTKNDIYFEEILLQKQ